MLNAKRIATGVALLAAIAASSVATEVRANERTLLMVDDADVLYRAGTERFFNVPKRTKQDALVPADKPWEKLIGYVSVYRNPETGKYQLWYQAYAGNSAGDRRLKCVVCYAESDDGITFTKPELTFFPFKGQPSNIVLESNAGTGDRYGTSVIVDANEKDPARRYKMVHYDWSVVNGREEPGLQVAFSPDGIRWTKHPGTLLSTSYGRYAQPPFADESPYLEIPATEKKPLQKRWFYPLTMSDVMDVFYDPKHGEFVVNAKMWIDGPEGSGAWRNVVGQTRSKDFLNWSKATLLFGPDDQDGGFLEFHGGPTFFHADRYLSLVHVMDRRYDLADDIELMVSADGKRWERPFRDTYFIARSERGLFDSQSIWSSTPPVILDNEMRFYYGAYNFAPREGVKAAPGQRSGVGLVTLPRDRFGGVRPVARSEQKTMLKPVDGIGQVTFKPIDLGGVREILVNADASKGSVAVELLNEDGYRIRGFAKEDAEPVRGDELRQPARWKSKTLADLPAGRYMMRVHLDNASLFAVTLQ